MFGFKALAGTQAMRNTLESRSIIIQMMKSTREDLKFRIDETRATELRSRLLMWRMTRALDETIGVAAGAKGAIGDDNLGCYLKQFEFADGRLTELFHSLYMIAFE